MVQRSAVVDEEMGLGAMKEQRSTSNAVDILHRRYVGDDRQRQAALAEAPVHAEVARVVFDARSDAGLTQKGLADLVGTTHSVISRLEDEDYERHSLSMLNRIAKALNRIAYHEE